MRNSDWSSDVCSSDLSSPMRRRRATSCCAPSPRPSRRWPPAGRNPEGLMTRHIGIVGCSAEGAALCYRTICTEGAALLGPHAHPEVPMHAPSLAEYVACLARGDPDGVAALLLASAEQLVDAGAELTSDERRVRKTVV